MYAFASLALLAVQSSTDDGLTFQEVVEQIPTDPATLFTLLLLLGSVTLVVWSGRNKGGGAAR